MLKRVGESTQPCFIPLLIRKGAEAEPSYRTVLCMSEENLSSTTDNLFSSCVFLLNLLPVYKMCQIPKITAAMENYHNFE